MVRPSPARRRAAETVPLSRERVCREALALVDDEGLDALSMRRLGARLGVEAMSLYRHVRDKADLLDALHVAVLGDIAPVAHDGPEGAPAWRVMLGGMARGLRATLLRHPHVVALFATRPVTAPEALRTIGLAWTLLEQDGFSRADAEKAVTAIGIFTIGHALSETQGRQAPEPTAPRQAGQATFDFGLTALLDGIAGHAPPASSHASPASGHASPRRRKRAVAKEPL
jgi:AcrR family transcriptional regulator